MCDLTGLLLLAAGVLTLGAGTMHLWRCRARGGPWWRAVGRRAAWSLASLAVFALVVLPLANAVAASGCLPAHRAQSTSATRTGPSATAHTMV
jgi:hypothetical protein